MPSPYYPFMSLTSRLVRSWKKKKKKKKRLIAGYVATCAREILTHTQKKLYMKVQYEKESDRGKLNSHIKAALQN